MQMGLEVEVFVTLADALIEERNVSAHFSLGECGGRVSTFVTYSIGFHS